MMTKEQYLTHITERIPVEKYPTDWAGYKRWTYQEDGIAWDQISTNGKRYSVGIYNVSHENPPTSIQYFEWVEYVGPPDAPTDFIEIDEIPDDVAADSLEGMYNPPPLPQPPVEVSPEALLTTVGFVIGAML